MPKQDYEEFVKEFGNIIEPLTSKKFLSFMSSKEKRKRKTTIKGLEQLLEKPGSEENLRNLAIVSSNNKESTNLVNPITYLKDQLVMGGLAQAITATYHWWTLDRKEYFKNWSEDSGIPLWAGGGPDLFWRERIEDHGLALLLGLMAGGVYTLYRKISTKQDINTEIKKLTYEGELIKEKTDSRENQSVLNKKGIEKTVRSKHSNLNDLIQSLNESSYVKLETPLLAKRKRNWVKYAIAGSLIGVTHGILYEHSGTHHDIQTLVKNLCCRPGDSYRDKFVPDAIDYFQTVVKPIAWGAAGALIANAPNIIKEGMYNIKNRVYTRNKSDN